MTTLYFRALGACLLFLLPQWALAQTDLIAPVTGAVTRLVENDAGDMVPPQATVSATVVANDNNGVITANVSGTASCTGGLGLHFTFEAQYSSADNSFVGMYSDVPGNAPDKALSFTNNGGYSWTAQLSGMAPSPTGARAYDLQFHYEIPSQAIFQGNALPAERTYGGTLATSQTVVVPLSVPIAQINQNLNFNVEFNGSWSAVSIPQLDDSVVFTGEATGTFASTNTETVIATVPGAGQLSIPVQVSGSFGGTLFLIDGDTVSFQGSWVGTGANQTVGGYINIDIEFQDTSSFPFSVSGSIPVETGFEQLPLINIPFAVSGSFPLSIQ